jgi:hypothetical protein
MHILLPILFFRPTKWSSRAEGFEVIDGHVSPKVGIGVMA